MRIKKSKRFSAKELAAVALIFSGLALESGCGFTNDKTAAGGSGGTDSASQGTGGSNTGTGSGGGTPAPVASPTASVTFQEVDQQIFQPLCSSCHGSGGSPDLSSYSSFATNTQWIVPGNPSASLIYEEVASGAMPRGGTALSASQLTLLSDWITEGAQND